MNTNIDKLLDYYSKVTFEDDLNKLEQDVKNRLIDTQQNFSLKYFIEKLFGVPFSLGGSAIAITLIAGIILGIQLPTNNKITNANISDLEIFSPAYPNLPSSLLDPTQ